MPNRATSVSTIRTDLNGYFMETMPTSAYLALEIMPGFEVPDKTGNYPIIPAEALLTPQSVARAAGAQYQRSDHGVEDGTYSCKEYGHEMVIDDGERKTYAKHGDYDKVLAMRLRNILLLKQEIRVKDVCHNTTTFALSGNTGLSITNEWDDNANCIPIDDIQVGKEALRAKGSPTNNLVLQMAWGTWYDLWRSAQILDSIKYVVGGRTPDPTDDAKQAMCVQLGVKKIIVGDAFYNSAVEGATPTFADVWSKEYAFLFNAPSGADLTEPCFGRTFHWNEDGGLFTAEQYRDESRRSDVLRVRQHVQEKTMLTACGFLFGNVYTA